MVRSLRHSFRRIAKHPGFAILAVLILAVGIGAAAAIFTFVDALLLRPVPFPDLAHMIVLWTTDQNTGNHNLATVADYLDWRAQSRTIEHLAAYTNWSATITGSGDPQRIIVTKVTPNFFDTLHSQFELGESLRGDERTDSGEVVISDGLWRRMYGGRSDLIGKSIEIDNHTYVVRGVVAAGFEWPTFSEAWVPLSLTASQRADRVTRELFVIGRTAANMTAESAQAELSSIASRLASQYPLTNTGVGIRVVRMPGVYSAHITDVFLLFLVGAVGCLLLVACSNVASLLVADTMERRKEIAIRTALGAGKVGLVGHIMTYAFLLSIMGASVGILVASAGVRLIRASIPPDQLRYIPGWQHMHMSLRVGEFSLIITVIAALLSILPALGQVSRPDVSGVLKEGSWGSGSGSGVIRIRTVLVICQIGLASTLLLSTVALSAGVTKLSTVENIGFHPDHILTMRLQLPEMQHENSDYLSNYYRDALDHIRGVHGVTAVGATSALPFTGDISSYPLNVEGKAPVPASQTPRAAPVEVGGDYFDVMRIPLIQGRLFNESDSSGALSVAIISAETARRLWPNQNPIARRLRFESGPLAGSWVTVVGIVGDVRQFMLDSGYDPTVYVPYWQAPTREMLWETIRTSNNPVTEYPTIHRAVSRVEASVAFFQVRTMNQVIDEMTAGLRITSALIAVCGFVAIGLGAAGIYGAIVASVLSRTREIALRIAFGASRKSIVRLFVLRALRMAGIGLFVGIASGILIEQILAGFMFQLGRVDMFSVIGVTMLVGVAAGAAGYLPARRAAEVSPLAVLRES